MDLVAIAHMAEAELQMDLVAMARMVPHMQHVVELPVPGALQDDALCNTCVSAAMRE